MSNRPNPSWGVGILGLLGVLLYFGLKLAWYIDWSSWWWVKAPIWKVIAFIVAWVAALFSR